MSRDLVLLNFIDLIIEFTAIIFNIIILTIVIQLFHYFLLKPLSNSKVLDLHLRNLAVQSTLTYHLLREHLETSATSHTDPCYHNLANYLSLLRSHLQAS